jgi:hypothetical protein
MGRLVVKMPGKIEEYIKKYRANGISDKKIAEKLAKSGYPKEKVSMLFSTKVKKQMPKKSVLAKSEHKGRIMLTIAIIAVIAVIIILFSVLKGGISESEAEENTEGLDPVGDPVPSWMELSAMDCCTEYINSGYTEFASCPSNFAIPLASALINQDTSYLEMWNPPQNESKFTPERFIFLTANNNEIHYKVGDYLMKSFANAYFEGAENAEGIMSEIMVKCNELVGEDECSGFKDNLDISSDLLLFPALYIARTHFEKINSCPNEKSYSVICDAIVSGNVEDCANFYDRNAK